MERTGLSGPKGTSVKVLAALSVLGVSGLVAWGESSSSPSESPTSPTHSGLTESTGITLTILDVEVRDKDGRPLRGLRKEDFKVRLNSLEWPLYSVDDLCTCSGEAPGQAGTAAHSGAQASERSEAGAAGAPGASESGSAGLPNAGPTDPLRYVIFLDFGNLRVDGRARAFREARRWIQEVKGPADEVMVAGYAEQKGLVEVSPFTADAVRLLDALGRAEADSKLQDTFPSGIEARYKECQDDTARCLALCGMGQGNCPCFPTVYCQTLAYDEYQHGRHSLIGLKDLLVSLESTPGRKALLHFQQNGSIFPGRIYNDRTLTTRSSDQVHLLDEVGAEANLARTAIHGAYVGDRLGADTPLDIELADQSVTLASNLADATGGTYGRDLNALKGLTSAVRRDCSCTYRLGLEAPPNAGDRVYTAYVEVRGQLLPHAYRVVFLDEAGRWLRQALAVLRNPERASRIPIGAALVPVPSRKGGWDVRVQVAFDLDALEMIPEQDGRHGSWEAGAVLARDDGAQEWDLMSVSSVRRSGVREGSTAGGSNHTASAVLHEHVFTEVAPGRLTLRAFVRDRTAQVMGGGSASLDLPRISDDGLSGPVLLYPARRHLLAPLPLFTKGGSAETRITGAGTGEVPSPSTVRAGEALEAVTWICPRQTGASKGRGEGTPDEKTLAAAVTRDLTRDGGDTTPLSGPGEISRAGDCYRFRDKLSTGLLSPGTYTYTLRWKASEAGKPRATQTRLTLEAPASKDIGATPDIGSAQGAASAAHAAEEGAIAAPDAASASGTSPTEDAELEKLLDLLAQRAELHHSLLYRFQCTEDLTRNLQRRPNSAYGANGPADEVHDRCGIVVEKRKDGVARAVRTELDRHGNVSVTRKGEPIEAVLKPQFLPVAKAVPHAQAATFTKRGQQDLVFHLVGAKGADGPDYRIRCPQGHIAVEFLDRQPLEPLVVCHGQASGQMCVDPETGEISILAFYGLIREEGLCRWDRSAPFALVEQGLIEKTTGARFPSRVRTIFSVSSRDNALFDQRYENCGFTNVETLESYGDPGSASAP